MEKKDKDILKKYLGKSFNYISGSEVFHHSGHNTFLFRKIKVPFGYSPEGTSLEIIPGINFKDQHSEEIDFIRIKENYCSFLSLKEDSLLFQEPFVLKLNESFNIKDILILAKERKRKWSEEFKISILGKSCSENIIDYFLSESILIFIDSDKNEISFSSTHGYIQVNFGKNLYENLLKERWRNEEIDMEFLSSENANEISSFQKYFISLHIK